MDITPCVRVLTCVRYRFCLGDKRRSELLSRHLSARFRACLGGHKASIARVSELLKARQRRGATSRAMRSRGALHLAAACCAVLATSAVLVSAPPPPGNATATAKPPRFDVQEVSTQLFLDIAGA